MVPKFEYNDLIGLTISIKMFFWRLRDERILHGDNFLRKPEDSLGSKFLTGSSCGLFLIIRIENETLRCYSGTSKQSSLQRCTYNRIN